MGTVGDQNFEMQVRSVRFFLAQIAEEINTNEKFLK